MYTQLEQRGMAEPPVNVSTLRRMKADGEPIADLSDQVLFDRPEPSLARVAGSSEQGYPTRSTTARPSRRPAEPDDGTYQLIAMLLDEQGEIFGQGSPAVELPAQVMLHQRAGMPPPRTR